MSRGRNDASAPHSTTPTPAVNDAGGPKKRRRDSGVFKYLYLVLVGGIGILLMALIIWLVSGGGNSGQSKYVDGDRYQAVFLNNNQVYFGKITKLNSDYMLLNDVFYLQVNQTSNVQPGQSANTNNNNNLVLQKLGKGELHGPDDTMIINADQVTFWENITNEGKVVEAIKKYKENPDAGSQSTNTNTNTNSNTNNNSSNNSSNNNDN